MTNANDTRFDAIAVGQLVLTLAAGWLRVERVASFLCTVTWRDRVKLFLVDDATGARFELTDGPAGTIAVRDAEQPDPEVGAATLLRLIAARADGEIGGPAVDAKIDELTERFTVPVVHV